MTLKTRPGTIFGADFLVQDLFQEMGGEVICLMCAMLIPGICYGMLFFRQQSLVTQKNIVYLVTLHPFRTAVPFWAQISRN